jgi:hypothetical protein
MQYALILALPFLFYPATSFSMLTRTRRQESQRRIQEHVNSFKTVDEVNNRIDLMKDHASKEYIQEFAQITNIPYTTSKTHIDQTRILLKEALKLPDPNASHDPAIPASLYTTICTSMRDEEVAPQSTTLIYRADSQNSFLFADARSALFVNGSPVLKPQIQFYPPLLRIPQAHQSFICEHEFRHILLNHSCISYIAQNANPTANPNHLISAQEKEADIYAASKNAKIAHAGAISRCTIGHAAIIDHESHCHQMQLMYALMKRKEELS